MPDQLAESPSVYGADLLNKDTGGFAFDLGLGPERKSTSLSAVVNVMAWDAWTDEWRWLRGQVPVSERRPQW